MKKYSISINWSEEDNSYITTCKEYKYMSAFGNTPIESLEQAMVALKLFEEYESEVL